MNWLPGLASPYSAWIFSLLIPLVILYFLKLKREQVLIPSLVLWKQVLEDQRVNSPFQKFRRSLLLLAQLLALIALCLAALQPFWPSGVEGGDYLPVIVDCSASMESREQEGGPTRLEVVQGKLYEFIDGLSSRQRICLISSRASAQRLTEFTENKRVLREAVDRLVTHDEPSRPEEALRLAQALARAQPVSRVLFFTDANIPSQVKAELPFEVQIEPVPPGGPNIGITACNARRIGRAKWEIFVRIEAAVGGAPSSEIEILKEKELLLSETVLLKPSESHRAALQVESESAGEYVIRLKPSGFDSLESDNSAFLSLPAARNLVTYVHPSLTTYQHALKSIKDVELYPRSDGDPGTPPYDLLITSNQEDLDRDHRVALTIGFIPEELQKLVSIDPSPGRIIDWNRGVDLFQHAQFSDLQIAESSKTNPEVGEEDFERLGFDILMSGQTGPLIVRRRENEVTDFHLLFHSDRSTLPYRLAFPVMLANLVRVALDEASLNDSRAERTGVFPPRPGVAGSRYRVTGPRGIEQEVTVTQSGLLSGIPAPFVGNYSVTPLSLSSGEQNEERSSGGTMSASLLDSLETSLAPQEQVQFSEVSVKIESSELPADSPLWPNLAFGGFCLVVLEWWLYHRRPQIGVARP